ncbi:hypothetical protein QBC39DRAFT_374302 [Podospora conica]|nr:hypothetical protein QBC39DRAFT_374302 [Schizothecium conicum]
MTTPTKTPRCRRLGLLACPSPFLSQGPVRRGTRQPREESSPTSSPSPSSAPSPDSPALEPPPRFTIARVAALSARAAIAAENAPSLLSPLRARRPRARPALAGPRPAADVSDIPPATPRPALAPVIPRGARPILTPTPRPTTTPLPIPQAASPQVTSSVPGSRPRSPIPPATPIRDRDLVDGIRVADLPLLLGRPYASPWALRATPRPPPPSQTPSTVADVAAASRTPSRQPRDQPTLLPSTVTIRRRRPLRCEPSSSQAPSAITNLAAVPRTPPSQPRDQPALQSAGTVRRHRALRPAPPTPKASRQQGKQDRRT